MYMGLFVLGKKKGLGAYRWKALVHAVGTGEGKRCGRGEWGGDWVCGCGEWCGDGYVTVGIGGVVCGFVLFILINHKQFHS
jgi:hypothetical protein